VPTAEASARVFIMFGDSWVSFWNGSTAIHWRAHSHAVAYMPTCAYGSTAYSCTAVAMDTDTSGHALACCGAAPFIC
jgi:hypothetical protein